MLIGIDWGGTKIEGVALTEDGKELTRRREPTPRHDYNGCIQLIAGLVQKIEQDVMGGGMSNVNELYTDLPPELAQYTFCPEFETPIRKALHGDSSGVRWAAWLWKES
jgi:predicted NBD/HSP70 family sugar kinase